MRTILKYAALVAVSLSVYATSAFAHAVVFPRRAEPGAYEKYVLRVPNERDQPTTRVELRFPAEVSVVSFTDVAGWKLEIVTDSAKRITGAVWTGTLAPQRFAEFPFIAVNPKTPSRLVWAAIQTYGAGERVEWTGPEGSENPASVTVIAAGADAPPSAAATPGTAGADAVPLDSGNGMGRGIAVAALVISIVALGVALRNKRSEP